MNTLDLIILIILLFGAWKGFRRGLISTSGGLLGFLGGIWLAGRYYIPAAQFLETQLGLEALFTRILVPFTAGIPAAMPAIKLPNQVFETGFPPSLWVPVSGAQAGIYGTGKAQLLAGAIVKVAAFLLIMAVVSFAAIVLTSLLSKIARLFLLGGFDRLGGVGHGLATRALELVVIIGLLTPVMLGLSMSIPGTGGWIQAFLHAWQQSSLIPLFNGAWNLVAPALKSLFM